MVCSMDSLHQMGHSTRVYAIPSGSTTYYVTTTFTLICSRSSSGSGTTMLATIRPSKINWTTAAGPCRSTCKCGRIFSCHHLCIHVRKFVCDVTSSNPNPGLSNHHILASLPCCRSLSCRHLTPGICSPSEHHLTGSIADLTAYRDMGILVRLDHLWGHQTSLGSSDDHCSGHCVVLGQSLRSSP